MTMLPDAPVDVSQLPPRRVPLCEAEPLAAQLAELLEPACVCVEVAGSVRRQRPEVKDIEIVCIPRMVDQSVRGLPFAEPIGAEELVSAVDERVETLCGSRGVDLRYLAADDTLAAARGAKAAPGAGPRPACNGRRQKRLVFHGIKVDLFILIPPVDWGVMFTLRTGPEVWSKRLVTERSRGGLLPDQLRVAGGQLLERDGHAIPVLEEQTFFAICGVPWIEPAQRTFEVLCRLLQGHAPAPGGRPLGPANKPASGRKTAAGAVEGRDRRGGNHYGAR
jgi:DNA polymerase/3'-5' exonuclease PolX